jgi:hypothetical protein
VSINARGDGMRVRSFNKTSPSEYIEYNFTLGFYANFPAGSMNPITLEIEPCNSGHYASCISMREPSEYCVFHSISVIEGNVIEQVVVEF